MTAATSPYVGPRAFQAGETLYGRATEAEDLRDLLIANRVVLLYSPSGAGKTSLVQAGLVPRLEEEGFTVLPVVRVDRDLRSAGALPAGAPPAGATPAGAPPPDPDRHVASVVSCLREGGITADPWPADAPAEAQLRALLDAAPVDRAVVLIVDQFETLFTTDPADRDAKARFFEVIGSLVRDRHAGRKREAPDRRPWILIALREEFLAALDPYLHLVPGRLAARMRLELLDEVRALEAIQAPAAAVGVTIDDAAARKLVDDLRRVTETLPDGSTAVIPGRTVEPVQLQVACLRLWQRLTPAAGSVVGPDDIPATGSVDTALADYYAAAVGRIASELGVRELDIREWFGGSLIVQHAGRSVRAQVSAGITPAVRAACEDAYLVRGDERAGARWYELAHDRLMAPILEDNARWLRTHASPLQLRARAWHEAGRRPELLLRDKDLDAARAWMKDNATSPIEQDLVDQSLAAAAVARSQRRTRMVAAGFLGVIGAMLIAGLALLGVIDQTNRIHRATRQTLASERLLDDSPAVAIRLAMEALQTDRNANAEDVARSAVLCCPAGLDAIITTPGVRVWDVALDSTGSRVISAHDDRRVVMRDRETGSVRTILTLLETSANAVAWDPVDETFVAVGDSLGGLAILDLDDGSVTPLDSPHTSAITSLRYAADGGSFASGDGEGGAVVWDLQDDRRHPRPQRLAPAGQVSDLALSDSGRFAAAATGGAERLVLWDRLVTAPDGSIGPPLVIEGLGAINTVEFLGGEPPRLVVGDREGSVRVLAIRRRALDGLAWDAAWESPWMDSGLAAVRDLVVMPHGTTAMDLALGSAAGEIGVFRHRFGEGTLTARSEILGTDDAQIDRLSWSRDGAWIAAAGRSGSLSLWTGPEPPTISRRSTAALAVRPAGTGGVTAVHADGALVIDGQAETVVAPEMAVAAAIAADGATVALGTEDGRVHVERPGAGTGVTLEPGAPDVPAVSIALSSDGRTMAAVHSDGLVRTWRIEDGVPSFTAEKRLDEDPDARLAMDPAGTRVAVARCARIVQVSSGTTCAQTVVSWHDVGSLVELARLESVRGYVSSIAIDPANPADLTLGMRSGSVQGFRIEGDPLGFRPRAAARIDRLAVVALAYASSGSARLAVGTRDGIVDLLRADDLSIAAEAIGGPRVAITALAFSADGRRLAIAAQSGSVETLALDDASIEARACHVSRWVSLEMLEPHLGGRPPAACAGMTAGR